MFDVFQDKLSTKSGDSGNWLIGYTGDQTS